MLGIAFTVVYCICWEVRQHDTSRRSPCHDTVYLLWKMKFHVHWSTNGLFGQFMSMYCTYTVDIVSLRCMLSPDFCRHEQLKHPQRLATCKTPVHPFSRAEGRRDVPNCHWIVTWWIGSSAWQAQSGTACTRLSSILSSEHVCHFSVTFPDLV